MDIPKARLPRALDIPEMYFRPPTADVPAYKPMIIPPSDLERPEDVKAEETSEQPEPPSLKIPVLDIQMPIPETAVKRYSPWYHFFEGDKYFALGGTVVFSITVM